MATLPFQTLGLSKEEFFPPYSLSSGQMYEVYAVQQEDIVCSVWSFDSTPEMARIRVYVGAPVTSTLKDFLSAGGSCAHSDYNVETDVLAILSNVHKFLGNLEG
jgi:hypothetical protein